MAKKTKAKTTKVKAAKPAAFITLHLHLSGGPLVALAVRAEAIVSLHDAPDMPHGNTVLTLLDGHQYLIAESRDDILAMLAAR